MGRRALRKVDPSLDLAKYLKTMDQLPRPWDASLLFSRPGPLEVEVGSGKGLFLRTAAAAQPDTNFLGIEVAAKYARFAAAMLLKRNLHNAIVVRADALRFFSELLPDCLSACGARVLSRSVVEKAAQKTAGYAGVVSSRHSARSCAGRDIPLLDRRGRVFPHYLGTYRGLHRFAGTAGVAPGPGRSRHGLSHPL